MVKKSSILVENFLSNVQWLVKKVEKKTVLQGLIEEDKEYDFIMTNPPFYKNYFEAQGLENTRKPYERHDPSSINTAQDFECIFDEGLSVMIS